MRKQAILFINLGTPLSPQKSDVKNFLREFLMDEDVISLKPLGRWLLVNLIIVPFRAGHSSRMYRAIWGRDGSPIVRLTQRLVEGLRREDEGVRVEWAMRYPKESIAFALDKFRRDGITDIKVVPLYPQRTRSNYVTTMKEVYRVANGLNITEVESFYDNKRYLENCALRCKSAWGGEHIIFSFHSVPLSHIECPEAQRCNQKYMGNVQKCRECYRFECYESARLIAQNINTQNYSVAFQSKMGRSQWMEPSLKGVLASGEYKEVMVYPAGFIVDCLETLYELDIEMRELFLKCGGKRFVRPMVNE